MGLEQIIDTALLEILPLMPSTGNLPFTAMRINRDELLQIKTEQKLTAPIQLLILKRTDFDKDDLLDYVVNSKEYQTLAEDFKTQLIQLRYGKILESDQLFEDWNNRITALGIGLVRQVAINRGLQLQSVSTDLDQLNRHLGLNHQNLSACELFDVHQIDPSALI